MHHCDEMVRAKARTVPALGDQRCRFLDMIDVAGRGRETARCR